MPDEAHYASLLRDCKPGYRLYIPNGGTIYRVGSIECLPLYGYIKTAQKEAPARR